MLLHCRVRLWYISGLAPNVYLQCMDASDECRCVGYRLPLGKKANICMDVGSLLHYSILQEKGVLIYTRHRPKGHSFGLCHVIGGLWICLMYATGAFQLHTASIHSKHSLKVAKFLCSTLKKKIGNGKGSGFIFCLHVTFCHSVQV